MAVISLLGRWHPKDPYGSLANQCSLIVFSKPVKDPVSKEIDGIHEAVLWPPHTHTRSLL